MDVSLPGGRRSALGHRYRRRGQGRQFGPPLEDGAWRVHGAPVRGAVDLTAAELERDVSALAGFVSLLVDDSVAYHRSFGGGETSSDSSPAHVYRTTGTSTVFLTVAVAGRLTGTARRGVRCGDQWGRHPARMEPFPPCGRGSRNPQRHADRWIGGSRARCSRHETPRDGGRAPEDVKAGGAPADLGLLQERGNPAGGDSLRPAGNRHRPNGMDVG